MEVMPPYTQTEVGLIPSEWEVKEFRQVGHLSKGRGLLKEDIETSGAVPAIPYTALYTDFSEVVDYGSIRWFVDDVAGTIVVNEPCVLIASSSNMAANTGKASALAGTMPVAIGREVIIFRTDHSAVFFSYLLSTAPYRKRTLVLARGTTIKHLYPATFANYRVAVPPPAEQLAITEALRDTDALLAGLDRLIAKKRDLKQAAMQQLLTGQTRLPGFQGAWQSRPLASVVADLEAGVSVNSVVGGGHHSMGEPGILKTSCVSNGVFDPNEFKLIDQREVGRARLSPRQNTLIISRMNTPNLVGEVGFVERDYPNLFLPDRLWMTRLRSDSGLWPKWLAYQMSSPFTQVAIKDLASGTSGSMKNISKSKLLALNLDFPPSDEQEAVAAVLSDMDTELTALEARRNKTRALKQGMMQELLTGRTRLV